MDQTQEEAIMKMELSEDNFLIFRSEEDTKLKVIYRRSDGNFGVIELELTDTVGYVSLVMTANNRYSVGLRADCGDDR